MDQRIRGIVAEGAFEQRHGLGCVTCLEHVLREIQPRLHQVGTKLHGSLEIGKCLAAAPLLLVDEPTDQQRLGVVLVARRILGPVPVEDRLEGVEREIEPAASIVIASERYHRRSVVWVLLQRFLGELLCCRGVLLDRFDLGESRQHRGARRQKRALSIEKILCLARLSGASEQERIGGDRGLVVLDDAEGRAIGGECRRLRSEPLLDDAERELRLIRVGIRIGSTGELRLRPLEVAGLKSGEARLVCLLGRGVHGGPLGLRRRLNARGVPLRVLLTRLVRRHGLRRRTGRRQRPGGSRRLRRHLRSTAAGRGEKGDQTKGGDCASGLPRHAPLPHCGSTGKGGVVPFDGGAVTRPGRIRRNMPGV